MHLLRLNRQALGCWSSPGQTQPLTVFLQCRRSVLIVETGTPDAKVQMIEIFLNRGPPVPDRDRLAQANQGCS